MVKVNRVENLGGGFKRTNLLVKKTKIKNFKKYNGGK